MDYIAHVSEKGNRQLVKDHLINTANLSREYSIDELSDICYALGLFHDLGKYQDGFQRRINGQNIRIDHSICGAKEIKESKIGKHVLGLLMELCIAGHHSGIPNCGNILDTTSLSYRLVNTETQDYNYYKSEITSDWLPNQNAFSEYLLKDSDPQNINELIEKYAFITRYCFSCLTDADSIDTMTFEGNDKQLRLNSDFNKCQSRLEKKLQSFNALTNVQKARYDLSNQAMSNIDDSEIFLMNMPTGSGKTLASIRCALKLVKDNNLKRIIYVIPYNSIIDQTVNVFETLFGEDGNILRHQSSFSYEDQENIDEEYICSAMKSCENWDADIIVTTAVQFFESLYGNKRGKLRKVHNMAESVIVFDEAHLMPREYLQPCLSGIGYIAHLLHSKILFLTATMPDYGKLLRQYAQPKLRITELIKDKSVFRYFKKSDYQYLGEISTQKLIEQISSSAACLVVMNTRNGAREVYSACSGQKYHLSTYMTGIDREKTIKEINLALNKLYEEYKNLSEVPEHRRIVVVSTSLIEAGVDLDFIDAYRELSGLDNILQTGGRCNREGKRTEGHVYVFKREMDNKKIKANQSIAQGIFEEFGDITSSKAIEAYFTRFLWTEKDKFIQNSVSANCTSFDTIDFKTYSNNFHIIDGNKVTSIVIVRDEKSNSILEQLKNTGMINPRNIQRYCCSVYQNEFDELLKQGVLDDFGSGIYFLTNSDYYDEDVGIQFMGIDYFI